MKKNPKEFDQLTEEYYQNIKDKGLSYNLCNYVWKVLVGYSRGYGFNSSHTLAYSLIALQEMNLAFKYPIIFWNCACLITDAGGNDEDEDEIDEEAIEESKTEEPYYEEMEEFDEDEDKEVSSYDEDDGANGYPATIVVTESGRKKKKVKSTNYGKVASAIGKMQSTGVEIAPPSINSSTFTFSPDVENNSILYGMSGITRIGKDLIKEIIKGRPYTSIEDFTNRIKITKPQVINLIKAGAFDEFGDRIQLMRNYIGDICGAKKRLTLQNMKMLIDFELIPDEFDLVKRTFNFNKYLKKLKEDSAFYGMDNIAFNFYSKNFDIDLLNPSDKAESGFKIKQLTWDKIYQAQMDKIRPYIKAHHDELLAKVNEKLMGDMWKKYCEGNVSKWEMDAISCYIHEHELASINPDDYGWSRFEDLEPTPQVERYIPIKGKMVPILKLSRIYGTVLDRDKSKKTVTLLTTGGVVTVKIYGGVFAQYDKQISEKGADGKKHVIRKSEFARGNKIIVTGVRDGKNEFRAKVYKNTPYHQVETIKEVNGKKIVIECRQDLDLE